MPASMSINYDTEAGVVVIEQTTTPDGIALIQPIKVVVPMDAWIACACEMILGRIQDARALQHAQGLGVPTRAVQG